MSQQQQQQNQSKVFPSLDDLDKPPVDPQPGAVEDDQQKPPEGDQQKPPVDPITNLQKPEEGKKPGETEPPTEEGDIQDEGEVEDDPLAFYSEVEKLRGDDFKFVFPEGVDPDTPQGIHHAITTATEYGIEQWEKGLMKEDPRGYAYLLHRSKGGSDEEFFSQKTEVLPEWDVLKNSVDLQQAFYRRVLTRKEIDSDQIDGLIKDAVEKGKLTGLVEKEYNRTKKQDEDQLKEMLRISQENREREDALINKMGVALQEKILQNKGLGITIPDAKRSEFLQYFTSMVHFDGPSGRFFIKEELSQENINAFIEALYYLKVGGNLSEIIKNKASEQNTKRLKLNMQKDKTKISSKPGPSQQTNKPGVLPTLSEVG